MRSAAAFVAAATAIDNGLGRLPPMGWRSWNCYHRDIDQAKMTAAANAFVDTSVGARMPKNIPACPLF